MRRVIAEKTKVRAGDLVRISVRLPSGMKEDGRITIWERSGEDDYSPFVPTELISAVADGKPSFLTPLGVRLHSERRHHTFTILADKKQDFRVLQETDTAKDKLAKARIRRYGETNQAFGRHIRNGVGAVRSLLETFVWFRRRK